MSTTAKWIIAVIVIILIIAGVWYLGGKPNTAPAQTGPIKVGFLEPLTGDAANIGINGKAAVEIALDKINKDGGINGRQIEMVYEDGKCDGATSATAAQKLVNIDKVVAIVGGACSSETVAAAPIAEQGKVVMLSPVSSSPAITTAGDYIFRDYPSDSFHGSKAAALAVGTLKAKNIAVLACQSDWCAGLAQVFMEKVKALGGNIVAEEKFDDKTTKDFKTQLTKIKAAKPDLIFFPAYEDSTITGLKQAKELGMKTQFLGGDSWDDPKIVQGAGNASEGIIYLRPSTLASDDFKAAMLAKTGNSSLTAGAPQAYDAISILAEVMKSAGSDGTKIKDALYQVQNYQGISGSISFDQNGDLVDANYDTKTVKGGQVVDYQP